ncbi:hypothetical protein ABFO79_15090, partial [Acinetobacter schindleri]|uniref:GA-like domain-containing protein n=1 Tax=Acinetobacter schindleri TaxID=108981 RepID=UPI003215FB50
NLEGIELPAVGDADNDDEADSLQEQAATAAVLEAEQAYSNLENAIEAALGDGVVTQEEADQLAADLEVAEGLKETAQDLVDGLDDSDVKTVLEIRLEGLGD